MILYTIEHYYRAVEVDLWYEILACASFSFSSFFLVSQIASNFTIIKNCLVFIYNSSYVKSVLVLLIRKQVFSRLLNINVDFVSHFSWIEVEIDWEIKDPGAVYRVLLPLFGGQGSGGLSCGRCAVAKALRFQILKGKMTLTWYFWKTQATPGEEEATAGNQVDGDCQDGKGRKLVTSGNKESWSVPPTEGLWAMQFHNFVDSEEVAR